MRIRSLKKKHKSRIERSHEEKAISDMFDSDSFELELTTDDPTYQKAEPFDTIDLKLSVEDTAALWEESAVKYAKEVRDAVVASLSFLESIRGVEEHLVKDMNTNVSLLDQKLTDEISKFLSMKLQILHLDHLNFPLPEKRKIFSDIILSGSKTSSKLLQILKEIEQNSETNPYGLVHKKRETRTHES